MIKILADQNIYKLSDSLPEQVNLTLYDPNLGLPELKGFDALFIRSVTKIGRDKLEQFPRNLKFIGTGSSGRDHVDESFLDEQGIHFVDAKGSNANVVAEYVVTGLILLSIKDQRILNAKIGIIGVGSIGQKVFELLNKLGYQTVLYDPPREKRDSEFKSASLEEVLCSDVLTFHVPLERNGSHPTYHWLDNHKLLDREYLAIINAARGGVIDERAVIDFKREGKIKYLITDVWENEPDLNPLFVESCDIATPHIAGSSVQSKLNASRMLAEKLCSFFELELPLLHRSPKQLFELDSTNLSTQDLISKVHPMLRYDSKLREIVSDINKKRLFARLRTDFPYRNEYAEIRIPNLDLEKHPALKILGVSN